MNREALTWVIEDLMKIETKEQVTARIESAFENGILDNEEYEIAMEVVR